MKSKRCTRCKTTKPVSEFRKAKDCSGGVYCYCRKCHNKMVRDRSKKIKQKAVNYKGGKCAICGYNKCLGALEFHHTDPKEKDFTLGRRGISRISRWEKKVRPELDKCILLCANCHREIHDAHSS